MVPTIQDVVRRAGVSRSTVSYALSGKRTISRATRERIEAAIAELGFTPHAGARALATSQTTVIGLFVQFFEDEFSPAMLQYVLPISDAALEAGYDILMVTEFDGPHAVQRILSSGMVDGVVLLNVAHEDPRLPVLRKMRQPGSMVGLPRSPEGFDVFDLDFAEAGRILIDHLAERGHREIILITPHEHVFKRGGAYSWRFRDAALQRAAGYGIRVRSYYGETQQAAVNQQLNQILDARDEPAMIVHNDAVIAALPSVLYSRGVRVPDDLSVVGMFSEDFGGLFSLPYTAVETSPNRLGGMAVEALGQRMAMSPGASPWRVELVASSRRSPGRKSPGVAKNRARNSRWKCAGSRKPLAVATWAMLRVDHARDPTRSRARSRRSASSQPLKVAPAARNVDCTVRAEIPKAATS